MNIIFKNKGVLSLLDLTTMGDSVKRDDSTKIGTYDSGLKYALSILYRNGIKVDIYSGNSVYSLGSKVVHDEITTKTKELMIIKELRNYNSDEPEEVEHITAFSPNFGHEWKVWMAIRELYSNTLDEGGRVEFINNSTAWETPKDSTTIMIHDNDLLSDIIVNWENYFLSGENVLYEQCGLKIIENNCDYLRLYKNKILIFEDSNVKSRFVYDWADASIDEMRILNNKEAFTDEISSVIRRCDDSMFIHNFIDGIDEECFESGLAYWNLSQEWVVEVNNFYQYCLATDKEFKIYPKLYEELTETEGVEIGVKKISYSSPTYCWSKAKVEIIKEEIIEEELSFEDKIKAICINEGFEVKYPIILSSIDNHKAISAVREKIIYVNSDFNKEDLWEIVKAQMRIESNDSADYVYKEYVKLLNK